MDFWASVIEYGILLLTFAMLVFEKGFIIGAIFQRKWRKIVGLSVAELLLPMAINYVLIRHARYPNYVLTLSMPFFYLAVNVIIVDSLYLKAFCELPKRAIKFEKGKLLCFSVLTVVGMAIIRFAAIYAYYQHRTPTAFG